MDLENLNRQYSKLKGKLEKAKEEAKKLGEKAKDLIDDKKIQEGKVLEAKKKGDKTAQQIAEAEIKRINEEIKKLKQDVIDLKEDMQELIKRINSKILEIKENPEMKSYLDEVLATKYERKIKEIQKEKDKVLLLKDLAEKHPTLANNLKGILVGTKQYTKLTRELKSLERADKSGNVVYTNPTRADEINKQLPEIAKKILNNKNSLITYFDNNKIDIKESDLVKFAEQGYVEKGGKIDLEATFNKREAGLNKSISNYERALSRVDRPEPTKKQENPEPKPVEPKGENQGQEQEDNFEFDDYEDEKPGFWKFARRRELRIQRNAENRIKKAEKKEQDKEFNEAYKEAKKENGLKWWQFGKKRELKEEIKEQLALPEPESTEPTEPEDKKEEKPITKKKEFRNSLKYEIVQDIINQMEKDNLKEAKKENKKDDKEDKEPDEEELD